MSKTFIVPVLWKVYGNMEIQAESEEEAIKMALGEHPLPVESTYVDDSIEIDDLVGIEIKE